MAGKAYFWAGFMMGSLTGAAIMAAISRDTGRHGFAFTDGERSRFRDDSNGLRMRRESSESAGDPAQLASSRTGAAAEFERQGGAPGGIAAAEMLEAPGRPGQRIDLSQPVKPASRTLQLPENRPTRAPASKRKKRSTTDVQKKVPDHSI